MIPTIWGLALLLAVCCWSNSLLCFRVFLWFYSTICTMWQKNSSEKNLPHPLESRYPPGKLSCAFPRKCPFWKFSWVDGKLSDPCPNNVVRWTLPVGHLTPKKYVLLVDNEKSVFFVSMKATKPQLNLFQFSDNFIWKHFDSALVGSNWLDQAGSPTGPA